jgi:hypothetical protein
MTALGRLGDGTERFSWSLNLERNNWPNNFTDAPDSIILNLLTDLAADVREFHGDSATRINPAAVLEEVKFAAIGADGKYVEDPIIINVQDIAGGDPNGSAHAYVTPQTALAISLVTDRRGPTGKGRFYLPMPVIPLGADFKGQMDIMNLISNRVQVFLQNVNNAPNVDDAGSFRVVVASTKGYNTLVTGSRVGRVVDTIRSRRGQLSESYTTVRPV